MASESAIAGESASAPDRVSVCVLALHGKGQTADVLSKKCDRLFARFKQAGFPVDVLDGPFTVVPADGDLVFSDNASSLTPPRSMTDGAMEEIRRAWFDLPRAHLFDAVPYVGFDVSVRTVVDAVHAIQSRYARSGDVDADKRIKPKVVLFGFSQGASIACYCVAMQIVDAAIVVATTGVRDPVLVERITKKTETETEAEKRGRILCFSGERDDLVPLAETETSMSRLPNVTYQILTHGAGHVVPSTAAARDAMLAFLEQLS